MQCCINFAYVFWMAIQGFRCHDNFFHLCLDKGDIIIHDIDEDTLKSLHTMCVNEVRKINGIIDYEDAIEYQKS